MSFRTMMVPPVNRNIFSPRPRAGKRAIPSWRRAAILSAVDATQPPMHLFLGEDALRHTREQMDAVLDEMAEWQELSLATNFAN